ncbi:MAG TPA: DUF4382 domain-containing protein [Candidatus Sulfotelmatobacter sp.]|nr:DUF4382 domain-containing protein [Candidatus Sulfotelmatobacter sp.]
MKKFFAIAVVLGLSLIGIGCGSNSSSPGSNSNSQNGNVFVTGEDAPASAVVGFNVTIDSLTLNSSSSTVNATSSPEAVDFARLIGLRTLLGFNAIAPGTYTSVTFTFENTNPAPMISYVDMTTNPPSVKTLQGSFSQTTVTVPFPNAAPLVVDKNGLAGLHIDFDVEDSLATTAGQITGVINPVINVAAVSASDEVGEITDFTGNVVSTSSSSFQMQGPYGMPRTIDVDSNTRYNGSNSLGTLTADAIVSVIGTVQADGSILAKYVELITSDKAFISGRILAVNPSSGPATSVTMWVGEEVGTSAVIPVDTVATIDLSGVTNYEICFFDNWLTQQVFSNTSLVVGQRIFIGGTVSGGVFTPDIVSLRRQGVFGTLVSGSVTVTGNTGSNQGYFQMQNDALMSYSAGGPFYVYTGDLTWFENINGLSGLASAGTPNLVARGLVFKSSVTGKPIVVAGRVRVLPQGQ